MSKKSSTFATLSPQFMITNAHILTIDACLGDMRSIVRNMDESPEKQELTELISHLTHEMFAINTDLTHSQHELTELRRQIYEPFVRAQAGTVCRYIDLDTLNREGLYSLEEFDKKLRQAAESEARVLCDFLHKYEKIGYLDFHSESKKHIFMHLQECYPTMRQYKYNNFAANF